METQHLCVPTFLASIDAHFVASIVARSSVLVPRVFLLLFGNNLDSTTKYFRLALDQRQRQ